MFPAPGAEQGVPETEPPAPDAEQGAPETEPPALGAESPAPDPGAEQSITTIHINNPNKQSTSTTSGAEAAAHTGSGRVNTPTPFIDDVVVAAILIWMGFDGRLSGKDRQPSLEIVLAWGLWVKLYGQEAKNPVGVARSKWRLGEWPGNGLPGYAREKVPDVLAAAAKNQDLAEILDLLADEFGQPSLENQIPAQYRGIIKT